MEISEDESSKTEDLDAFSDLLNFCSRAQTQISQLLLLSDRIPPVFVSISLMDPFHGCIRRWLQPEDFEGKELSLKLHRDGTLGSFESSSGKLYEVVSFAAQEPDATVLLASASESKVVGKVSRRVCFVHYPEPGEMGEPSSKHPFLRC